MIKLLVKQKKEDTVCYVVNKDRGECDDEFAETVCQHFGIRYYYDRNERTITFHYINAKAVIDYIETYHCDEIEIDNRK